MVALGVARKATPVTERFHVIPVNDLIEHDTESDNCVCVPDLTFLEGGLRITHHSLDGREERETRAWIDKHMARARELAITSANGGGAPQRQLPCGCWEALMHGSIVTLEVKTWVLVRPCGVHRG